MDAAPKDVGFYRRKFPRRTFKRSLSFLMHGDYFMVTSCEIGEGGMAFSILKPIQPGQEIVLNFRIPSGDFVSLRAEIRSVNGDVGNELICGVAFKNISFSSKRQIRAFVSSRGATEALIV